MRVYVDHQQQRRIARQRVEIAMKTKNFPAKVNARRVSALKRLMADIADRPSLRVGVYDWRKAAADTLTMSINHAARDLRSKKPRADRAKAFR
jgi:hypothetical protein